MKVTKAAGKSPWSRWVRQLHLYLGIFFAPSIIFFSFSGALQLFSLHEGHPGDAYHPPEWIEKLASIHKDQTIEEKHGPPPGQRGERERPPEFRNEARGQQPQQGPPQERRPVSKLTVALKWFFLFMAVGLIFTTLLGIYMAFQFTRSRVVVWSLLIAGIAVPAVLIALMAAS